MSRAAMLNEGRKDVASRLLESGLLGFNAGDTNLYRYVGNSPTNATDPSGLIVAFEGKAVSPEVRDRLIQTLEAAIMKTKNKEVGKLLLSIANGLFDAKHTFDYKDSGQFINDVLLRAHIVTYAKQLNEMDWQFNGGVPGMLPEAVFPGNSLDRRLKNPGKTTLGNNSGTPPIQPKLANRVPRVKALGSWGYQNDKRPTERSRLGERDHARGCDQGVL